MLFFNVSFWIENRGKKSIGEIYIDMTSEYYKCMLRW